MLKSITSLCALFLVINCSSAIAQAIGGNTSISVTTTTSNVALPASNSQYPSLLIIPDSSSVGKVFYSLGSNNTITATTSSPALPSGGICFANIGPNKYIAAITGSGTATLQISQYTQCPQNYNTVTKPSNATGANAAATVGISDSTVAAASMAVSYLDLVNNSPTATICVNLGATATISGTACSAGEITLPPLWHRSWEGSFIPADAVHAIASAASTPMTVGVK